jgi:PTH1 family peptidyl-tRNA hydrolase
MKLIVGLGNPGPRYADTRHNIGFRVVERLSAQYNIRLSRNYADAILGDGVVQQLQASERVLLALPQSFMNLSGNPVAALLGFYKLPVSQLAVVHDDLDLPFGRLRLKVGGGHGGHNGIRDILRTVAEPFLRIKVGIGRPPPGWETINHVLGAWTEAEKASLDQLIDGACDAVLSWIFHGSERTMNRYNSFTV